MERVERIGGIKYHLNRLTPAELENIRAHSIAQISGLMHDVEVVEAELAARRPEEQLVLDIPQIERTNVVQADFRSRVVDL